MTIRIGAGPLGWYQDDFAAIDQSRDREAMLVVAARGGYDGASLGPRTAADVTSAMATLARHQLGFVPHTHDLNIVSGNLDAELGRLRRRLRHARALGTTTLTVAETTGAIMEAAATPLSQRPQLSMTAWVDFGQALADLARAAAAEGVELVYRPQVGTIVQTPGDIDQLMAATGGIGLMLDIGQIQWGEGNPVEMARRYASSVRMVQASAVDVHVIAAVRGRDLSYAEAVDAGVFLPAAAGAPQLEAVLAELPGFAGWIMLDAERGGDVATVAHCRGEPTVARPARTAVVASTWYRTAA